MCPNIFELADGDFLAVGRDVTIEAAGQLPVDAGCAAHERVVLLPRVVVMRAFADISAA
ncbi:hypothetical protein [Cryptosporangium sp. NPDC051539]|uniref:hypothetical protein n=1 Tax=Cryptosporangium sp. NPDC051539 TaxID=3363962 RepID=UPI00378DB83D